MALVKPLAKPELKDLIGRRVNVTTNSNKTYTAMFNGYDDFMNIVLGNMQQINDEKEPVGDVYPKAVLRGQNVKNIVSLDGVASSIHQQRAR